MKAAPLKEHIANFLHLSADLKSNTLEENIVAFLESNNNIFPEIDYSVYA